MVKPSAMGFMRMRPILCVTQALIPSRGVSHCGLAIYIKKYCKAKRRIMETNSNISPCKNIIIKKSSQRKPKSFKIS
jgi:hypothetical protein